MKDCAENLFHGNWKSYKSFYQAGQIRQHSRKTYQEFEFGDNKLLTITRFQDNKGKKLWKTNNWEVEFSNKKYFLNIEKGAVRYEIITINHVDMVLTEMEGHEKVFYARPVKWKELL
jgi:hypothetical protein